jgi:hypothetical protein
MRELSLFGLLPGASRAVRFAGKEDVMIERNLSSNADWLVALLLVAAVVAALI